MTDIDIVVDIGPGDVDRVARSFPIADFYFPPEEVVAVEVRRTQRGHFKTRQRLEHPNFNFIHHDTGFKPRQRLEHQHFKADFYPKGSDALQEWALAGAHRVDVDGAPIALAHPST